MARKRSIFSIYPHVYHEFVVKEDDKDVEFVIQNLTDEFFESAVPFIVENHARGAVFHRAARTLTDEKGNQKVHAMYENVFKEKNSLICLVKGTNEIAGLNALTIKTRNDFMNPDVSVDPCFRLLNESINFINSAFNVFDHYEVDRVLSAAGLAVDKKYRGKGIATQILKTRALLMKSIDLKVTTSIFSTEGAQKAAASAGYDENYSITYEELQEKFPEMNFSFVYGRSCKVLSMKI